MGDAATAPDTRLLDTFSKLLRHHAEHRGDRIAMREKDLGIWQSWTWAEVAGQVRDLACGLAALGLKRGDRLAVIGDNRPRLYWSICAAQALGAVPVPLYQDAAAEEMAFVLEHAEARIAIAEDQEQVDKLLQIKPDNKALEQIVFDDPRGLRNYRHAFLHDYESILAKGRDYAAANPGFYDAEVARTKGADVSTMLYTSGTTGRPKGVMLSYDNVLITARNALQREGLTADEDTLAYLPMAWVGDHIFSYGQALVSGFTVNCPESSATVLTDLRELGPTYFFAPPRIYESILTTVMIRMEDAGWLKRRMFHYFMDIARRCGTRILDGKPVSLADRLLYRVGALLVYQPLKNTLGFSRIRLAYTAGEAIGPDLFDFYRAIGVNVKQLYGMTEASVFVTIQPDGEVRADTVGTPAPEVEIKIEPSGEVLFRGPGVFQEYYKNPEATAEAKTAEGWVHTGDAGFFDADGHLRIIDRAKDVGKLADGSMFAPKYLENKLKFFPFIKEAVAFGDGRAHVGAFINIDLEAVGNWAERRNLPYGGYADLASREEVYDLIQENVEQVNRDLAGDSHLSGSQIRRFLVLYKELDADDGELTRTRKVRRNFVAERYGTLIEALYSDATTVPVETEIRFEDGRTGTFRAELRIRDVKTYPPAAPAAQAAA
ncbi:MAG: AMP-binding protein [Inquilinus sp.]|nr:AMP-binding protein [Inquilinus sp.]